MLPRTHLVKFKQLMLNEPLALHAHVRLLLDKIANENLSRYM